MGRGEGKHRTLVPPSPSDTSDPRDAASVVICKTPRPPMGLHV